MSITSYGLGLLGGAMIGLSTAGLLYSHGRRAGISGILGGGVSWGTERAEWSWRAAFLLGLVVSGTVVGALRPEFLAAPLRGVAMLGAAGFLAGLGARLSGGCTSGHGISGLGSLSRRSLIATVVFMLTGALTVALARRVFGGMP